MGAVNTTNGSFYIDDDYVAVVLASLLQPSDENEYRITRLVFSIILTILFSGFGLITNVINILVFYRQGILSESCTPTLVAMAVSDICVNFTSFTEAVCYALSSYIGHELIALNKYHILANKVAGPPFSMFTLFTCFTTAYLAFERMISVTFPFRVRELFRPRRSALANLIILCVLFILHVPGLFPQTINVGSMFGLQRIDEGFISLAVGHALDMINGIGLRLSSVIIVTICNIIVGLKVHTSENFRKPKASAGTSKIMVKTAENTKTGSDTKEKSTATTKETKLIRMMFVLSLILLVCNFPSIFLCLRAAGVLPMTFDENKTFELISRFLQVINSSCNIIVYYIMSSKYRKDLTVICSSRKRMHAAWSKSA